MYNRYQGVGQFYLQNRQMGQQFQAQAQAQAANQALQMQLLQQKFSPSTAAKPVAKTTVNEASSANSPKPSEKPAPVTPHAGNVQKDSGAKSPILFKKDVVTPLSEKLTPQAKKEAVTPVAVKPNIKSRLSLEPSGSNSPTSLKPAAEIPTEKITPVNNGPVDKGNARPQANNMDKTLQPNPSIQNRGASQPNPNSQNRGTSQQNQNIQNRGTSHQNPHIQNHGDSQPNQNNQNRGGYFEKSPRNLNQPPPMDKSSEQQGKLPGFQHGQNQEKPQSNQGYQHNQRSNLNKGQDVPDKDTYGQRGNQGKDSSDQNQGYQHGNRGSLGANMNQPPKNQNDNQYFNNKVKQDHSRPPPFVTKGIQNNSHGESNVAAPIANQSALDLKHINTAPPQIPSRNYEQNNASSPSKGSVPRGNQGQNYQGYDNRRSNMNDSYDRGATAGHAAVKMEQNVKVEGGGWNENRYQQRNERQGHWQGGMNQRDQGYKPRPLANSAASYQNQRLYYGMDKLKERINHSLSGPQLDLPPLDTTEKKFNAYSRLFIGNLPKNTPQEELETLFGKFGEIGQTFVNKEASYAFITFDYKANASKAQAEMDEYPIRNRLMKVRFATISEGIKIKNLSPFVSNELLEKAFTPFGQVETCRVSIDERGMSKGEGLIIFREKKSAIVALKKCEEECFFLSGAMRPVIVSQLEYQEELVKGLTEASLPKNEDYRQERSVGPHFAEPASFEFDFGLQWKKLFNAYEEKKGILEHDFHLEVEKMEKKMILAKVECETDKLRRELAAREADAAHLRRHFGESIEDPMAAAQRAVDPYDAAAHDAYQTAARYPQDYDRGTAAPAAYDQAYGRDAYAANSAAAAYPRDAYDRQYDQQKPPPVRDLATRDSRDLPSRDLNARDLPARDSSGRDVGARDVPALGGRDQPVRDSGSRGMPAVDMGDHNRHMSGQDLHNTSRQDLHNTSRQDQHNTSRQDLHNTSRQDLHNTSRQDLHNTSRQDLHNTSLPPADLMDNRGPYSTYPKSSDGYGARQSAYGQDQMRDSHYDKQQPPVKRPRY